MPKIRCDSISPRTARIRIFKVKFPTRPYSLSAKARKGNWSVEGDLRRFKVLKDGSVVARFEKVKFSPPRWTKKLSFGPKGEKGRWTSVEHLIGDSMIFGLGEKAGGLEKRGRFEMWNVDPAGYKEGEDPLYCSFPFYLVISNNDWLALHLDHPEKSVFDVKYRAGFDRVGIAVNSECLCFYLLIAESLKEILKEYSSLVGKPLLPPRWALGYHQSTCGYPSSKKEMLELARKFRKKKIPCDVLHLDIQYLDKYKVFTWKREFGNPKSLIKELHDCGFKVVTIVDPGVKIENGYEPFESGKKKKVFLRNKEGDYFKGGLWPGLCHFPDFLRSNVREWWAEQHERLLKQGADGIWNDMNELTILYGRKEVEEIAREILEKVENSINVWKMQSIVSRTPKGIFHKDDEGNIIPNEKVHNLYGLEEAKATARAFEIFKPGRRPFILTRSGFSGIQRYAAVWTGDNSSSWNHLKLSIPMCLNLGISGAPFVGVDVGGFIGDCEPELLTRWTQLGAFLPFFRNHSTSSAVHQEPWTFGEPYESINREAIELRYKLLPYLYFLFFKAHKDGIPPMRPLFMEFPNDKNSHSVEEEFMLGKTLLVAPVLRRKATKKMIYLPYGKDSIQWEDWWTGKILNSGYHLVGTPLKKIPLYIKEGSGLPVIRSIQNTEKFPKTLKLRCNLAGDSKISEIPIYWDDGKSFDFKNGNYFLGNFRVKRENNKVEVSLDVKNDGFKPFWKKVELDLRTEGVKVERISKNF